MDRRTTALVTVTKCKSVSAILAYWSPVIWSSMRLLAKSYR